MTIKPFTPSEPTREPTPERFLTLLTKISGMKSLEQFAVNFQERNPDKKLTGGIIGLVVVGSASDPKEKPKDVDVIFISTSQPNIRSVDFATDLQRYFDDEYSRFTLKLEMGRLDNLGQTLLEENQTLFSDLLPIHRQAILESKGKPLVFAFKKADAELISQAVSNINPKSS